MMPALTLALGLLAAAPLLAQDRAVLTLPESTAERPPALRCHVVIDSKGISVDGAQAVRFGATVTDGATDRIVPAELLRGPTIAPLYDVLLDKREQEMLVADARRSLAVLTQRSELDHDGELLVSIDAATPFSVVRQALYTAGQAQYARFLFVVHNPWEQAARTIEFSLPAIGPPRGVEPDEQMPQLLTVLIDDRGLDLLGPLALLYPDGAPPSGPSGPSILLPCLGGGPCVGLDDYDWGELSRLLGRIKGEHPEDWAVIVAPSTEVPFDVIVRTMDTARWSPYLPPDASRADWERWREVRGELFPFPTLAGGAE
jgi:hypothetical protein